MDGTEVGGVFLVVSASGLAFPLLGPRAYGADYAGGETPSGSNVGEDLFLVYLTVITAYLFFLFPFMYLQLARPASPGLAIPQGASEYCRKKKKKKCVQEE